jgi:8-oxo-dGTP diphosphatase
VSATVWVAAAVLRDGARVLLTQRKADSEHAGLWEFPGGKVEDGEDPRAALVRELAEELGVDADVGEVLELTFSASPTRPVVLMFFSAELRPGSAAPRALDVADWVWRNPEDVDPIDMPPGDRPMLQRLRGRPG